MLLAASQALPALQVISRITQHTRWSLGMQQALEDNTQVCGMHVIIGTRPGRL